MVNHANTRMEGNKLRPFKVCNSQRTTSKGLVAENLEELKVKGCEKLGIHHSPSCRVFLESDGTEIEDEDYFGFLGEQTKLMLADSGDEWAPRDEVKVMVVQLEPAKHKLMSQMSTVTCPTVTTNDTNTAVPAPSTSSQLLQKHKGCKRARPSPKEHQEKLFKKFKEKVARKYPSCSVKSNTVLTCECGKDIKLNKSNCLSNYTHHHFKMCSSKQSREIEHPN